MKTAAVDSKTGTRSSRGGSQKPASAGGAKKELSSLHRGIKALLALNSCEAVSASSLALELGVPRTTARRVLDTLVSEGVAEKVPYETIYRLSPDVARLSSGVSDEVVISHVASPLLYDLTKKIGWALSIGTIVDGDLVIQVATHRVSPFAMNRPRVGWKLPISSSHAAWLTIAFLPDDEREAMVEQLRADPRFTPWMQMLREPISQIRQRGFSIPQQDQSRHSLVCLPIFVKERVKACLVMQYICSAMSHQTIESDYIPILKDLTARIEQGVREIQERHRPAPITAPYRGEPVGALPTPRLTGVL